MKSPNERDDGRLTQPPEISVAELKAKMNAPPKPLVVDIRETAELSTGMLSGAISIPMSQLMARLGELPKDKPLVLVCASGARSLVAQRFLSQRGYRCQSLAGGMFSWEQSD